MDQVHQAHGVLEDRLALKECSEHKKEVDKINNQEKESPVLQKT